ncbi:hypothetical protein L7F22_047500 [Adiantum nelumboides]|nr:hypothetical protein [Adiantum nelumboides]
MLAELPPSPLAFLLISSFKIEPLTPSKVKLGLFDNETTNVSHESGKVISKMAFSLSSKGGKPESCNCDKVHGSFSHGTQRVSQAEDALFKAQLISFMETFQQLAKHPKMQELLQGTTQVVFSLPSEKEDSHAKGSRDTRGKAPMVERQDVVQTPSRASRSKDFVAFGHGPVHDDKQKARVFEQPPVSIVRRQLSTHGLVNGQDSNEQVMRRTIPMPTSNAGCFGGNSVLQAMIRPSSGLHGYMPDNAYGAMQAGTSKPMYGNIVVQPGARANFISPELASKLGIRADEMVGFSNCFSNSLPNKYPPERPEDHRIDLVPSSSPPNRPHHKVSAAQQKEILSRINELLEKGLIQPNSSPFCSPVLLVQKKDGSWRMCIDYRALNKNTINNRFPIPTKDGILDRLEGASLFSRIDLTSGYHRIRIRPEDVHKTAFRTTFGLYEFLVIPFGLTNDPATFNRMMDRILSPHKNYVNTFFDDMIVFSKTKEEHRRHLTAIFNELCKNILLIDAKKSEFILKKNTFLGTMFQRLGYA